MKKVFLLALATALTIGSFAADKGKHKKHAKKATCTEQTCPPQCKKTGCDTPQQCCDKMKS